MNTLDRKHTLARKHTPARKKTHTQKPHTPGGGREQTSPDAPPPHTHTHTHTLKTLKAERPPAAFLRNVTETFHLSPTLTFLSSLSLFLSLSRSVSLSLSLTPSHLT